MSCDSKPITQEFGFSIATLARESAETLEMNAIGSVRIELLRPIAIDLYAENRATGAFILIDAATNSTVAAGMITSVAADTSDGEEEPAVVSGPVTAAERAARWGHQGGVLSLNGPAELIDLIERSLFTAGVITQRIDAGSASIAEQPDLLAALGRLLAEAGFLVIEITVTDSDQLTAKVRGRQIILADTNRSGAIAAVHQLLHETEILHDTERAGL